jgi:propanol-preferring alcohol dehydrogenase
MDADITAVDLTEEKLDLARNLGADRTINAATDDVIRTLRGLGGLHVSIVTSAAKAAYDLAFYGTRAGGTLVVVGMPAENLSFPAIMMREITIASGATGTRDDLREVLALAANGKLKCITETCRLEETNEVLEKLRRGEIAGRITIVFDGEPG